MRDDAQTREQLGGALSGLSDAVCLQLIRFRRHTVGSAAGHVLDVVADELTSSSDAPEPGRVGRRGEPGEVLVAHGASGELGRFEIHPIGPDFEDRWVPIVLKACARTGAAFELWVESERVLRLETTDIVRRRGYRDAPPRAGAELVRTKLKSKRLTVSEDGSSLTHRSGQPPRLWAAALLLLLAAGCFPITCVAMLFREPRETLLGMLRNTTRGWQRSWELSVQGAQIVVRTSASDAPSSEDRVDLERALLVAWPRGWTREEAGRRLVAISDEGIQALPCPAPEAVAEFLCARPLSHSRQRVAAGALRRRPRP